MKIVLAAVGKIRERGLREAIDDYGGRIARYGKFEEIEVASDPDLTRRVEKALVDRARLVTLEVHGQRMTSAAFATWVGRCESGAVPTVVFAIGGAYGLPRELKERSHLELSLSDMILPHRIARLVLAEQVYRAFTILRGEPYSHA